MGQETRQLFAQLETTGRFHRDTAVGRIFHPGTLSYREVSTTDSVHVAVRPDNRVSVHVDRLSPLLVRSGRCRYSLWRAVAHNVVVGVETVGRLLRRQHGHQTCHLDCEIVWVPDGDEQDEGVASSA